MNRELLQRALDALVSPKDGGLYVAIEALRAALAVGDSVSPGQPVAWIRFCSDGCYEGPVMHARMEEVRKKSGAWTPLYTHAIPPGFVLVPVEPTRAMWQSINKVDDAAFCDGQPHGADFESLWIAAIEAAPKVTP